LFERSRSNAAVVADAVLLLEFALPELSTSVN